MGTINEVSQRGVENPIIGLYNIKSMQIKIFENDMAIGLTFSPKTSKTPKTTNEIKQDTI